MAVPVYAGAAFAFALLSCGNDCHFSRSAYLICIKVARLDSIIMCLSKHYLIHKKRGAHEKHCW